MKDFDCPVDNCEECEYHASVSWCTQAIPNHEPITEEYKIHMKGFWDGYESARREYDCLVEVLNEMDKTQNLCDELRWISVNDKLPKGQDKVIVSICDEFGDTRYNYTDVGWTTTNGEYWVVDDEINNYVVAWMPMPKPYKGENKNE